MFDELLTDIIYIEGNCVYGILLVDVAGLKKGDPVYATVNIDTRTMDIQRINKTDVWTVQVIFPPLQLMTDTTDEEDEPLFVR